MDSKRVSFQPQLTEDFAEQIRQEVVNMPTNFNLSNRNIARLPSEIGMLTALERLGLNNNKLISLPLEMINLTALRYLNLRSNSLREFPSILLRMKGLEVLDISKNKIKSFPSDFGELMNLRVLSVSKNRLTQLPKYLAAMKQLRVLKLDGNPLTWPPNEFIQTDEEDDQDIWLNTLRAFLNLNDPPESQAALFMESPAPSPAGSRSSSPLQRASSLRSRNSISNADRGSIFNFENIQLNIPISPTKSPKFDSAQPQNCHKLLHSFLATYQPLISPLTRKYPYLDPYINVLYACVELYRICGYMCDVVERASKSYASFDPLPIHTEMAKNNLEALSLLKLLKEFLSCTSLDATQIDMLKNYVINLSDGSAVTVKLVLEHAIVLITPPNRTLDSRILAGLMTDWTSVNESLYEGLLKINGSAVWPAPKIKRNPTGHSYSSSLTSMTHKSTNSIGAGPNDQFRKIHASLIEMSNSGVPADAKQLIVKSLQYCLNQDAIKLLDNLVMLLFEVKNEKTVQINELSADLAVQAQELLTLLSSA